MVNGTKPKIKKTQNDEVTKIRLFNLLDVLNIYLVVVIVVNYFGLRVLQVSYIY